MAYLKNPYLSARNKNRHFLSASTFTAINYAAFRNTLRWDSLMLGVLVAYGVRQMPFQEWISKRLNLLRAMWLILVTGMAGMALSGLPANSPLIAIIGFSWIAAFFACTLLLSRVNPQGRFRHWLSCPALKPVATISYGLYLIQGPTMAVRQSILVERLGWPDTGWGAVGVNLLTLGVTVLAAAISWRFYESRMISLGHKHRYRDPEQAAR